MKRVILIAACFMLALFVPAVYAISETGFETDTGYGTDIVTDTGTETDTGTDTEEVRKTEAGLDGADEINGPFSVSVFVISDELRGGSMTVSYDPSVLTEPKVTLTEEEGFMITLKTEPGAVRAVFITNETFFGYVTLMTLDFEFTGEMPETVGVSLSDAVVTDGVKDEYISDVTYTARCIRETDTATDTEAPLTDTEAVTEPAVKQTDEITSPATKEPETTEKETVTTEIRPVTTEPETEPQTETEEPGTKEAQTETDTETEQTEYITTGPVTEPETETATEAVITAERTVTEPKTTEGEEEKNKGGFIIPAVIIASALTLSAATAVYIVKKKKSK